MKNIMIVDGALNCAYDVFQLEEAEFQAIFPGEGQDIAFIDEVAEKNHLFFEAIWKRPIKKCNIKGIHGILFYELPEKKDYYPNRKESDLDFTGRAFSVEDLK